MRARHVLYLFARVALVVIAVGCASAGPPAGSRAAAQLPEQRTVPAERPPQWRPGDRWTYEWTSGKESGTKVVEIIETRDVKGVLYYIARLDDVEHYYTHELHWAAAVRDARVETRMVPPQPWFMWPLEVGGQWRHRGTLEDSTGPTPHDDIFTVLSGETVNVPAGEFATLRILRRSPSGSDEYWYAPAARWYVRWIGRRGDVAFEERLREHVAAPRAGNRSAPSGTR